MIDDRQELRTYECDGLAHYKVVPGAGRAGRDDRATWPRRSGPAPAAGVPFVARGSGTGLSGGALPHADGVLVVTSRMRRILEVDRDGQRAVVEPGVINLQVTKAAAPDGYYYAPDPSSQQVCSIGGNVAENSGGAHCLKYGFTTNHVLGARAGHPGRRGGRAGRQGAGRAGLRPARRVVGSEGTLGIATEVTVRLIRAPGDRADAAGRLPRHRRGRPAVSAIIGAGVVPAAIEMMDALAIEAAEAAVHCGYPAGAGRGADRRAGRAGGRGGARSSPTWSGSAGSTARSRSGSPPTTPSGRCSGRGASPRSPRSAGSARTTSCRTA